MLERVERKAKPSAIKSMLSFGVVKEQEVEAKAKVESQVLAPLKGKEKKKNSRAYERYRGRAEGIKTKPMSYYLTDVEIQAIQMRLSREGSEKDKSAVVRAALDRYLEEEIQFIEGRKK